MKITTLRVDRQMDDAAHRQKDAIIRMLVYVKGELLGCGMHDEAKIVDIIIDRAQKSKKIEDKMRN